MQRHALAKDDALGLSQKLGTLTDKLSQHRQLYGSLTAMVSLWRSLTSGEQRATLTSTTLGVVKVMDVLEALIRLADAG